MAKSIEEKSLNEITPEEGRHIIFERYVGIAQKYLDGETGFLPKAVENDRKSSQRRTVEWVKKQLRLKRKPEDFEKEFNSRDRSKDPY